MTRQTFRVDNALIQTAPQLFASSRRTAVQLSLPGLTPFGPFDYWATLALYSLLDPERPGDPVQTTPTELLKTLDFAREVSDALAGYETFPSSAYELINDTLRRLFTVEVQLKNFWSVKTGKAGRPKRQWVEYRGRILVSYQFTYAPGVTPAHMLAAGRRRNVNTATTATGEAGPPIWREVEGPRPVGIEYRLSPDLIKGLSGEPGNIGATVLPVKIFNLRPTFAPYPIATRLLVWACRQTAQTLTRYLDKLADELAVKGKDRRRNREAILRGFVMLKTAGVIEGFTVEGDKITFAKAADWHFARAVEGDEDPPALSA
jgi:hypothetical protein